MSIDQQPFGKNYLGEPVTLITLRNANRVEIGIMTHGGTIFSLKTPDKNGTLADLVLGHDRAEDYTDATPYFGCITGRFANRIKHGRCPVEGRIVQLAPNDENGHHLHGGIRGLDKRNWIPTILAEQNSLLLEYVSPDGEENYPGNLSIEVTYTLNDNNELIIHYEAKTDRATPINLTNHTYFNLGGHNSGDCLNHRAIIHAETFFPTDSQSIPTGEIRSVTDTPFDFQTLEKIGARIDADDEQLLFATGYDHNYCLGTAGKMKAAARVEDPKSGRILEVETTEPGLQFYSGNKLDGSVIGKENTAYKKHGGFCLETQHWPDSPNHPEFPNTILQPGKTYQSTTIYRFSNMREKTIRSGA